VNSESASLAPAHGFQTLAPLAALLTTAAILWVLLLIASPLAASRGHARYLTAAVYQAGSLVCHQRPERSFHLDGVQLPVCARCFGLYASGALGVLIALLGGWRWSTRAARIALASAAVPIAASVGLEWIGAIATTNVFRMFTALPLGSIGGLVMIGVLRADR
jgi:uncharacterized membrane protein